MITRTVIPAHPGWSLRVYGADGDGEFWIEDSPDQIIAWIVEMETEATSGTPEPTVWAVTCEGTVDQPYVLVAPGGRATVPLARVYATLEEAAADLRRQWKKERAIEMAAAALREQP